MDNRAGWCNQPSSSTAYKVCERLYSMGNITLAMCSAKVHVSQVPFMVPMADEMWLCTDRMLIMLTWRIPWVESKKLLDFHR